MSNVGSRAQVMHGTRTKTSGGLTKSALKQRKDGKIVSKAKSKPMGKLGKNEFLCLHCRKRCSCVENVKHVTVTTKSGRKQHAMKANCKKCGTKLFKFVKAGKSSSRKSSRKSSSSH
jgi:hypothetical protein